ncbi:MAG: hypothetical protein R3C58_10960 [Parvularculaceae bacterium]
MDGDGGRSRLRLERGGFAPSSEDYAVAGSQEKFVRDFVKAWSKVMMLDRFDVKGVIVTAQ